MNYKINENIDREEQIIQQIQKGDYQLFAEIIHSHQSSLYNFIFRIVHNRDDALDITQDTFFKAYQSIKSFKFKSKFSTWLFQIGYYESVNFIKKHNRRREIEKNIELRTTIDEYVENIERDELNEKIEKFLYKLRERQRIALHLLYKEEKSYKEIAKIMGLPMNTVKTHIKRGREALKEMLSEIYDPETMLA